MRHHSARAAFLAILLASTSAFAQICPASNSPATGDPVIFGIGDGCTTVGLEYVLPDIGIFRSTFTPSCNGHDKCLTTLGNGYKECNDRFLQDMRASCRSKYNPFWRPVEYTACYDTTSRYYAAVEAVRLNTESKMSNPAYKGGMQRDAFKRSLEMQTKVENNQCGTTPELTTLYSASLITKINSAFLTYAGRKPTIYEFFNTVHVFRSDAILYDEAVWLDKVNGYAQQRKDITPPVASYVKSKDDQNVHLKAVASYDSWGNKQTQYFLWNVNGAEIDDSSISFPLQNPQYNSSWNIRGFMVVTNPPNPYGPISDNRNMVLINETIFERGGCAARRGQACY